MIFITPVPVLPTHGVTYIYGYVCVHMLVCTIVVKLAISILLKIRTEDGENSD